MQEKEIYTIGYSGFDVNEFINVLKKHGINGLVDVRSNPNSKFYEQFNKINIERQLKTFGIHYRNFKDEFGARQTDATFYRNGYLSFPIFSDSNIFLSGIKRIERGLSDGLSIALMCAERDPVNCHRNILVAKKFHEMGYQIKNILLDGSYELQEDLEMRLVDEYFPDRNQLSLLSEPLSTDEMISKCYERKNEEIGYRQKNDTDEQM